MKQDIVAGKEVHSSLKCITVIWALVGLLLIAISAVLRHWVFTDFLRDFSRELGVVVLTVFTVSAFYEHMVQNKYAEQFLDKLRDQLQQHESNAASCARLGILEIFCDRAQFEQKHPLSRWISELGTSGRIRIIARSLFLLMGKYQEIRKAIWEGAIVELALLDPVESQNVYGAMHDVVPFELDAALSIFRVNLADWVKTNSPRGALKLKYHRLTLFDSYALFDININKKHVVWDLSFGRDLGDKRIILMDGTKGLGADLTSRYENLWDSSAEAVFCYEEGRVTLDRFPTRAESEKSC